MAPGPITVPEIIASHPGTDFDGLASMVAAQKLHPRAIPVTQGRMDSNVKEFLSLYGDLFKFVRSKDVDLGSVEHLITVDINRPARLGTLQELAQRESVRITVYDHHPPEETQAEFGPRATVIHRPYGSGTSALVELLRENHIPISPVEATLFALGIAEDTGHLSFPSVTPHDFYVMGYLHERGVKQDLVNRFLAIELDAAQKQLLQKLSLNIQKIRIKGLDIAFATARTREMVPEVAVLTRKVQDLENCDVIFALVESAGKTIIVGRSRTPAVDCNQILGFLGGGGHAGAAAATVPEENLHRLVQDLVSLVREHAAAAVIARDIMSSPVRTIGADVTIQEGYDLLLRSGHSGLVVTDEGGHLLGIMSRKDFDKARAHNLGHAPVKGYMSRNPIFVGEDASLEELADLIINHNVGRLPVVFGGRVVGIVTRSDVMRALHASVGHGELPAAARHQPERDEALA
ncbi:MAG TPA: CBS domain-containing protein, partial [bacterium]|nr:CBS domain-containing protein [bacterium]